MEKRELNEGDILQISPDGKYKDKFGGMLIVVSEPKCFGCQGYIMAPCDIQSVKFNGRTYLRVPFEEMEYIGHLEWILKDYEEVEE